MRRAGVAARAAAWLGLSLATLFAPPVVHSESLEMIQLQHRTAAELLPILQPLWPGDAALGGTGDVLLVRADAATVAQLRAAVASLDRAPRQLVITVGQATGTQGGAASVRGSGTVGSGDVQVGINEPPRPGSGATVTVRNSTASDAVRDVASVRALEGYETYIALGQSRPYTSTTVTEGGGYPPHVTHGTGYRDVQSGFFAIPRLNGDRVSLEISPRQQRVTADDRQAAVTGRDLVTSGGITTTVSGRLGEWIEIGGVQTARDANQDGVVSRGARSDLTQYSAWVKVDEVR
jgi:hypothetical protein